jgi:hypothetical protein
MKSLNFLSRSLIVLFILFGNSLFAASEPILWSVMKIKNYEYDNVSQSFIFQSYGSAIAIASGKILTNAHVILDSVGNTPTGYYEVCISQVVEKSPICRDTAKLITYDPIADLALLELDHIKTLTPLILTTSHKPILGSEVIIYWYPNIGGDTITRTQGKIAGYSAGMYKIDGTIDHGDSWGGAFDSSGSLIGIPTAVSSDNWVIGYMIDQKRIYKFLQKKTENYELFNNNRSETFLRFIQVNEKYNTSHTNFPFFWWKLNLPKNTPFRLVTNISDPDKPIITLNFRDTYDRVNIYFQCTNDGSSILGWIARSQWLEKEFLDYSDWKSTGQFEWKNDEYFVVYDQKIVPDDIRFRDVIYYTKHDNCYAEVFYFSKKLDAKIVKKAHEFLQNGMLWKQQYLLPNTHVNPYFTVNSVDTHTRVVESFDIQWKRLVNLAFDIGNGRWINSDIVQEKYATYADFFRGTLNLDTYSQPDDWFQFVNLIQKNVKHTSFEIVQSLNQKKFILLMNKNLDTKKTRILVYYPYRINVNTYAVWFWDFTVNDSLDSDFWYLRKFFSSLILPGVSPF